MEIKPNDQLFVNNKWYFDVIDIKDSNISIRIKYKENPNKEIYMYKQVILPLELFTDITENGIIKKCKVDNLKLKNTIGSLIDRIAKEPDFSFILEDAGMGDVSMSGINSSPGLTGSAGSGDISGALPKSEMGMEIVSPFYKKVRKKMKSIKGKEMKIGPVIKQPVISLSEAIDEDTIESDYEYKTKVFDFLDYPTDNEYDIKFINVINKLRGSFLNVSLDIVKNYFENLYNMNKQLIKSNTSDWFQNTIMILANIEK